VDKLHVVDARSILEVFVGKVIVPVSKILHVAVDAAQEVEEAQSDEVAGDAVEKLEHFCDLYSQLCDLEAQADVCEVVAIVASPCERINTIAL